MKTNFTLLIVIFILFVSFTINAQIPTRVGWWKFDDPNDLVKAQIGSALVLAGTQESVNGPAVGNKAIKIGVGSNLTMTHGIAANGGGAYVNEYSIQIDFSIPATKIWTSFFQTNPNNSNDADCFVAPDSTIGVAQTGYSKKSITSNTWYRMVVSVKNGDIANGAFYRIFINGELWRDSVATIDGRFALEPTLIMFGDNDGDDGPIICSEIGIWNVALTNAQAAELGDIFGNVYTGIKGKQISENTSNLGQNYPNPFSYSTIFPYQLEKAGNVTFRILDLNGKEIAVINEGAKSPGKYSLELNSTKLNSGVYYLQMTAGKHTSIRKMFIIK